MIELYDSRLSGKKKLIKDGNTIVELEEEFAFTKTFDIEKSSCTIIQHGDRFELRVDNQVFSHLLDIEKNKVYFGKNPEKTSVTIQSSFIGTENKKVGFGIHSQSNIQAKTQSKEAPMFSFAIKPFGNNTNNSSKPRRFTEINPVNDFNRNKLQNFKFAEDDNTQSNVNNTNKEDNVNLLNFDNNNDNTSKDNNNNNNQSSSNILDIFGNSDSFSNNNNNNQNKSIDLFQNFNQSNDNFNQVNQINMNFHTKGGFQNNYK